jgi:integrase
LCSCSVRGNTAAFNSETRGSIPRRGFINKRWEMDLKAIAISKISLFTGCLFLYNKRVRELNLVQPIRDTKKINEMMLYLKSQSDRNYILFLLGISTGLRISDILKLRKKDLTGTHLTLKETKTRKHKKLRIMPGIRKDLKTYLDNLEDDDYVIKSREGANKPIDRSTAYRILRKAGEHVGLKELGTHTCRKTYGYHFYLETKDVAMLQKLFNHSSPDITLEYIGINQDSMDSATMKVNNYWARG